MTMSGSTKSSLFSVKPKEESGGLAPSSGGGVVGRKSKKSYTLRACSIQKRMETEHRKNLPRKRGPKPRPKTAPMSKYRRKTANLRERMRMGEINVAFEKLRDKLPNPMAQAGKAKCEKLTKINILHVAINYIRAMENLLETGDSGVRSFSEMTKNPLRDESDKKGEMQRVLATLMQRADKLQALKMERFGSKRSRDDDADDDDDEDDEDDDEDDDMDDEDDDEDVSWTAIGDLKSNSDESGIGDNSGNRDNSGIPPPHFTRTPLQQQNILVGDSSPEQWSTSSADSGVVVVTSTPVKLTLDHKPVKPQADPLFAGTAKMPPINSPSTISCLLQNCSSEPSEDIMKDFTDFVEMVDSLNNMPDIELDDSFEIFS